QIDGRDVPVKLRVHQSPFVPLAKWPMLLTGNYRCITAGTAVSMRDAVQADLELSRDVYSCVESIVRRLGAQADGLVPIGKYAAATEHLAHPCTAGRAVAAGAPLIERVDKLIQIIGRQHGIAHPVIDRVVALVDANIARNRLRAA